MGSFFALNELTVVTSPLIAALAAGSGGSQGPFHPTEWRLPAQTSITVPATATPATAKASDGTALPSAPPYQGTPGTVYVFDAILRTEHSRELRKTENPIQTSASSPFASVCNDAYLLPARVTCEIGMSDALDSYIAGSWTSNASKSVSAYETLITLHEGRTLFTLTTRLATYKNMVVDSIKATDSIATLHGLRATVVFGQVVLALATAVGSTVSYSSDDTGQPQSALPHTTDATANGTVQPTAPSAALTSQHQVTPATSSGIPSVPGSGPWSSVNVGRLAGLLG